MGVEECKLSPQVSTLQAAKRFCEVFEAQRVVKGVWAHLIPLLICSQANGHARQKSLSLISVEMDADPALG